MISVRKKVAQLVALDREVVTVLGGGLGRERFATRDGEPVALEPDQLARVIGHDPDGREPQIPEDLGPDAVIPQVGREAEPRVGLDRILPVILERIGLELVDEPDPAPLLIQVHDDAPVLPG